MIYNGVNLQDYNVSYMDESAFIAAPSRSYSEVKVAGRNGSLHYSNDRYDNLSVKANCIIFDELERFYGELSAFLTQDTNYHRLEGFRRPDIFRMAAVKSVSAPTLRPFARGGLFTITFDCKPLAYVKDGEVSLEMTQSGSIHSDWVTPSKPLLRVYGWGTLQIGTGALTIASDIGEYVDIDCDIKDAYVGENNRNSFIEVAEWPELVRGENAIVLPSTVTKIEVTPRWATL